MMEFSALLGVAGRAVQKHLSDPVTYTSGAGVSVQVRGIFDLLYVQVDAGQAGVSSAGPSVFLWLADLPSDPSEDTEAFVVCEGTAYVSREAEPDGKGGVRLLLQERY